MSEFWRQLDIVDPAQHLLFPVSVIGCGGIGSPTVLALAKMGCNRISIWDDDRVEDHNLPNQLYRVDDVGKLKVDSLSSAVLDFTGVDLVRFPARVHPGSELQGVIISGVDTMQARNDIWQAVRYQPSVEVYVDARMGAEVCRIYTIRPTDPDDVAYYERTLYTDGEAQETPCTARAIIYNVFMIAALIGSQVKKFARGEVFPREIIFDLATLSILT
jgi:ThiF family protein